jgi:hypothetical protein
MGQVGIESSYYWLQVGSISIVGLACLLMSLSLFYTIYRIADLPFRFAYVSVAIFMLLLAAVQISELVGLWEPNSLAEIGCEMLAAIAGFISAAWLFVSIPKAMALARGREEAELHSFQLEQACEQLGVIVEKGGDEMRNYVQAIVDPARELLRQSASKQEKAQLELIQKNAESLLQTLNRYLDKNTHKFE